MDKEKAFSFCFHGSVVPDRLPIALIEAMARLPEEYNLNVCGYETVGSMGYVNQIMEAAHKLGIKHRIHYHGALSMRKDIMNIVRKSFVGINLLNTNCADYNLQNMSGASNKPFEYLAGGAAVLVPNDPEWEKIFVQPGYGLSCDPGDPESIYQALKWCVENKDKIKLMGEAGRQKIFDEWNYEKQFGPIIDHMSFSDKIVRTL
ncbi:MAG: glycosyltransferase [Candidatus Omnitrophica bacterium]|nr:glycosyltransferase [Candidatus Omnitrophota bacterium]